MSRDLHRKPGTDTSVLGAPESSSTRDRTSAPCGKRCLSPGFSPTINIGNPFARTFLNRESGRVRMALQAVQLDQAAGRGADIHVCRVDIRVDVRLLRVFNGADALLWGGLSSLRAGFLAGSDGDSQPQN